MPGFVLLVRDRQDGDPSKRVGFTVTKKIGNAHLKWAFSEAACLMLRSSPRAKAWMQRQEKKRGKRKALAVLEARLGRAVYHLWKKQVPFDAKRFLTS